MDICINGNSRAGIALIENTYRYVFNCLGLQLLDSNRVIPMTAQYRCLPCAA